VLLFRDSARDTGWKFRCIATVTVDASPAEILQAMAVGQALISKLKNLISWAKKWLRTWCWAWLSRCFASPHIRH